MNHVQKPFLLEYQRVRCVVVFVTLSLDGADSVEAAALLLVNPQLTVNHVESIKLFIE